VIGYLRGQEKTVGVLAVDPSSPFSGGALLGDRIRMQEHSLDPHVFIRSLATRGHLGGLSRAAADCLQVMDALGRDVILVETVGVGQDEVDVAQLAHCTVVTLVPGLGDDVQAIKAGILEVADVFAVNKADLDGADRLVREPRQMLELRHATRPGGEHDVHHGSLGRDPHAPHPLEPFIWEPPIVKTVAARNEGIAELWEAVLRHRSFLDASGGRGERERGRAKAHFLTLLRARLLEQAVERLEQQHGSLDDVTARLAERKEDPYALVEELLRGEKGAVGWTK
jgi:LAO/AO transport system kinase